MAVTKTLRMVFRTTGDKVVSVNLPDPDDAIGALDVEAVMNSIISRNVFDTTSGDIDTKIRSEIVEREVTTLQDFVS